MALVNSAFTVNVTPGAMPPIVHVSEYDVGRTYTVTINGENGSAFNIPTGTTATIEGTLNGSVGFTQSATISNNQVSFALSESMTAYSGKAWCKIKLTLNDEPIQTCAFVLAVDRAGVEAETVIGAPGFKEQINEGVAEYFDNNPPFFKLPEGGQRGQALLSDGANGAYWGSGSGGDGGGTVQYTNLLESPGASYKSGLRYSHGNAAFVSGSSPACDSIVVPISKTATNIRIRIRGATLSEWNNAYGGTDGAVFQTQFGTHNGGGATGEPLVDENGDQYFDIVNSGSSYLVFMVAAQGSSSGVIVTANEPISDGEDAEIGIAADVPEPRAPVPQLPADGSTGTDINANTATADDVYAYIDAVCAKYPNVLTKQIMGKDYSGTFDCNRYVYCRSYYHAWNRVGYPKMFAWRSGSTVVYSESVSPRVGDSMYSVGNTTGVAVGTVSSVNFVNGTASVSTRTVNGTVYSRDKTHDVDPALVYTVVAREEQDGVVYNTNLVSLTTISSIADGVMVGADSISYNRFPFGDKQFDGADPVKVFVLANEHGGMDYGDPKDAAIICARLLKDLCVGTDNEFLNWIRHNAMLTVIPVGNPWGFDQNNQNGYMTANHVNINRNYDVPGWVLGPNNAGGLGAYPGSEPETQYIMDTIQLSGATSGMSVHVLGNDPSVTNCHYQGNGFNAAKMPRIAQNLGANYSLALTSYGVGVEQDPWHCGKSPAYIQYAGLVGGLIELNRHDALTGSEHNAIAMEQNYTQILLFLWAWINEANKATEAVSAEGVSF